MTTPELLSRFETCARKGFWSSQWAPNKLTANEFLHSALRVGLTTDREDHGEAAGEEIVSLAESPGLATEVHEVYPVVINHAALADILVSALRKAGDPAWLLPEPISGWDSACLMSPDGTKLRRVVLVSTWTEARHFAECRSWYSLGEVCAYGLPMELAVMVLGQTRHGRRHSAWTTGFLHCRNHQLRFRKRSAVKTETFVASWEKVMREDHAEISREKWLQAMLADDVLPEVCFRVDIPVPTNEHRQRILDMAKRKLEALSALKQAPEPNLSTCDFPSPCMFKKLCHTLPERAPSPKNGFTPVELGRLQDREETHPR